MKGRSTTIYTSNYSTGDTSIQEKKSSRIGIPGAWGDSQAVWLLLCGRRDCYVDLADISEDGEGLVEVVGAPDGEDLDLVRP